MKKKKKKGLTKLERFICKSGIFMMVILLVGIVFTSATVSKMNIELQKKTKEVDLQINTNESLVMKINEMASLENIKYVSTNLGLSYNNENILTVE